MFYYIISTTYQKIGDLLCSVHISGLSHSPIGCRKKKVQQILITPLQCMNLFFSVKDIKFFKVALTFIILDFSILW